MTKPPQEIFTVERASVPDDVSKAIMLWAKHADAGKARKCVSDEIAALLADSANQRFQADELPKYTQLSDDTCAQVKRLRIFLEVLDEVVEGKYTKKTTITPKSL